MTTPTESNKDNKKEAEKNGLSGAWPLWVAALSPLAWLLFSMLDANSSALAFGLFWSATIGVFVPCVLIYFSWRRHFTATQAAVFLLLMNIGIAWLEFIAAVGYAA